MRSVRSWIVVAGTLVCASAGPATAASPIGLSFDGVHWSQSLAHPLFDPSFRWVPGDAQTASFFVRNQAAGNALLAISVRADDQGRVLEPDDVNLETRAAGGRWYGLTTGAAPRTVSTSALPVGDAVKVEVRAAFAPHSTDQSMEQAVRLTFQVSLYDALVGDQPRAPIDLPNTGSAVRPWYVWISAILIGAGLALVRRSRREERS
jgi:LPXTG-motif cell wall-anchored protein